MNYYSFGGDLMKIENSNDYVCVLRQTDEVGITINKDNSTVVDMVKNHGKKVDKACFWNAYQNALTKLQNHMEFSQELDRDKQRELMQDEKEMHSRSRGRCDDEMFEKYGHEAKEFDL